MSKQIDLSEPVSELDAAYLAGRPWIVDRWERANGQKVTYAAPESEESGAESHSPGSEEAGASSDTGDAPTGQENTQDGPEDVEEEAEVDYSAWNVATLKAEIAARNEQLDEDEQIEAESERKADLIAALEADDALAESEEA